MQQRTQELPNLGQFIGSEEFYRASFFKGFIYTEGVKHVAETHGAYWLIDVALSHAMMHKSREDFMTARLDVRDDDMAVFTLTDGNDNTLATQIIEFTDFPAKEIEFFIENGGKYHVMMLPSER